ncbi:MAG: DUF1232 domain-containing protein [Planctomycetales bacterium]|nr:DUF1232 domain-containing protein [Planctomycetales bacterium]
MNRVPLGLLAVLTVLYVLSPLDFIPDVIPFLGWLDDVGVLGYFGYRFINKPQQIES